jgi:hypothetical protein
MSQYKQEMNVVMNQLRNTELAVHYNTTPFFWEFFMWRLYRFTDYERKMRLVHMRNNPYWNHRVDYLDPLIRYRKPKKGSDVSDANLNREYEVACQIKLLPEMINIILSYL